MAEVTTYTPAQRVEVEGTKFQVRTAIVYATKENGGVDTGVELSATSFTVYGKKDHFNHFKI